LKRILTEDSTRQKVILPYIELLKKINDIIKLKMYENLGKIAAKIDSHFSETGILEYSIIGEEFSELKKFIKEEFIDNNKDALLQIISNIKEITKLSSEFK